MPDVDSTPSVPIVCPECGTEARVSLEDVADRLETHNERHHDGDEVATVDPGVRDSLADLLVEELGLYEE
jgi:hypothetical protein